MTKIRVLVAFAESGLTHKLYMLHKGKSFNAIVKIKENLGTKGFLLTMTSKKMLGNRETKVWDIGGTPLFCEKSVLVTTKFGIFLLDNSKFGIFLLDNSK